MELLGGLSYISYTIGAVVCGLAAIWIGRKGDGARADRTPAVVALALTANWCFAAASFVPGKPIVELTEIARNLSWLFLLFRLFGNDGRDETLRLVRPAAAALAFARSAASAAASSRASSSSSSSVGATAPCWEAETTASTAAQSMSSSSSIFVLLLEYRSRRTQRELSWQRL